ncbi:hypothetical protein QC762_105208 [Podospora pseudocomata]|uniref:Uncharacterized protein n=1 Tax=Podospora pseudocomata TaxID=2093779 RepID=A0ABR0GT05_9PEZI|nr:hypothetical protein QC762_105208 [Podospora pseudocomata]
MVAEAWRGPSLNLIHGVGSVPQILPEPASRPIILPPPFTHSFLYHRPRGYSQCPEITRERIPSRRCRHTTLQDLKSTMSTTQLRCPFTCPRRPPIPVRIPYQYYPKAPCTAQQQISDPPEKKLCGIRLGVLLIVVSGLLLLVMASLGLCSRDLRQKNCLSRADGSHTHRGQTVVPILPESPNNNSTTTPPTKTSPSETPSSTQSPTAPAAANLDSHHGPKLQVHKLLH